MESEIKVNNSVRSEELGKDFEGLMAQAREIPKVAKYLDIQLTKDQVIGYLMAAMNNVNFLGAAEKAVIVEQMEKQLLTLQPEEAVRLYAESWYKGFQD